MLSRDAIVKTGWRGVRTGLLTGAAVALAGLMSYGVGTALAQEQGGAIPPPLMKGEAGAVATQPTTDTIGVATAPAPDVRRVYIYDPAAFDVVTKVYSIDGTTGTVLGELDTGLLTDTEVNDAGDIFLAETWYSRFATGTRDDFVRCFDPRTLSATCDIDIPEGRWLTMVTANLADLTTDGRYLLYDQFSPAPGVGVVDLKAKKFLTTIDIPDCVLVFPSGPRSFVMECRDATLLNVKFDESGKATMSNTKRFREEGEHIYDQSAFSRKAGKIFFLAYDGTVYPVDISSGEAVIGTPWETFTDAERKEGWGPGGWNPVVYHRESGRLFVLADVRPEWTHVYASGHVLVYDVNTKKRIDDITLIHPALSINISQDANPLLYALDNHAAELHIYDANTGRYRQTVDEMGHDPYIIVTPEG